MYKAVERSILPEIYIADVAPDHIEWKITVVVYVKSEL